MSGPLSRALAGLLFVLMLVPGVSAASDDGMLVPDSAHAAAESETASVKRLRLAIVNSYGMSIMDDYYSRTIEAVKEKLTPIEIDVKIYGPDSFLKAAEKESFDMSIASSGLTSLMIERTGGRLRPSSRTRRPTPTTPTARRSSCAPTVPNSGRSRTCAAGASPS